MRASLLTKLFAAYLAPMLALIVFAPLLGYAVARRSLEDEVGKRLVSTASAAAATVHAETLANLQPGDETTRVYRNALARLDALRAGTRVERLYVFDLSRRMLVGTGDALPIGSPVPSLERDRLEIDRALKGEGTPSSVTFKGLDGRAYKSGYAPILDGEKVVAAVGADAPAEFFDALRSFGFSMVGLAAFFAAAGLLLFFLVGRFWLLKPIHSLLHSAVRIGKGDLASPVPALGKDELGTLSRGMEKMRAQLFDRDRELQLMLAGIAHEVRNPLGGIELFAGLLAEDLAGDAEKLSHVRRVQNELGHLKRVVEDFLGYARDPRLAPEPVALRPFLTDLCELLRSDADQKSVQVAVSCAEDLSVAADSSALRRALLNLLRNAIQATPEGGRVELGATKRDGSLLLFVQDEGPGVPEAERAQLFRPFHTTKEKGLGLGLALVKRIAEAHGGAARLDPSQKGARFVLEIPDGALFASGGKVG